MKAPKLLGENGAEDGGEEEPEENVGVDDPVGIIGEVDAVESDDFVGVVLKSTTLVRSISVIFLASSNHGSASSPCHGSAGGASCRLGDLSSSMAQQNAAIFPLKSKPPST